jgi:DnaJ-class molecular chaperone
MTGEKDYYLALGIPRTAGGQAVRSAFRELARQYRPQWGGPTEGRGFRDVLEAYEVLSDPTERAAYDRGFPSAREGAGAGEFTTEKRASVPRRRVKPEPLIPEPVSLANDFETFAPSFEEIASRIMRNFTGIRVPKGEGLQGLDVTIALTPDEAARGGVLSIGVPVFYHCPSCGGQGRQWLFPCVECEGQGMVEGEELLALRVPPLVREGSVLEAPILHMGIRNLYLRVHIAID